MSKTFGDWSCFFFFYNSLNALIVGGCTVISFSVVEGLNQVSSSGGKSVSASIQVQFCGTTLLLLFSVTCNFAETDIKYNQQIKIKTLPPGGNSQAAQL